ncbi:DNA-nicking endonuclease, Smr domain [Tistlia consotensis]|uniref:DNA-nicking endonuclease, Smr domain n=1 Tax=Tistlia consotensis USBA 355 TaxID=560819 RepID=A0A1Y6BFT5_9PROT|nr:Smr/MutS family protein [Tistlia consotensis]SMF08877.1 DNA-nicking endonuclease, Smr domain [Tistlia consotensis USBA 355]SNR35060.1 DNA-nicking endonuclease, Smr domain [Tistlia consotensis]
MAEDRHRPSRPRLPPDMDLWQRVAREVTPLRRNRIGGVAVPEPEPAPPPPEPAPPKARPERLLQPRALPRPVATEPRPSLSHGSLADLDRRTAQRLQRGRLPIEATLDLHGLNQAAAHEALNGFIARSEALGRRCVLIVTGKGLGREESGVLRRQVPHWLNQAPLRQRVLAFDYARPEHGGQGALYLLLKRRREKP